MESVNTILLDVDLAHKPKILVFNKIDLLEPAMAQNICKLHGAFGVSALQRPSLRPVLAMIEGQLWNDDVAAALSDNTKVHDGEDAEDADDSAEEGEAPWQPMK